MFERPLPEIQTGVPVRPVTLDVGIRTFAKLSDGGSLQRRARQAERSALRRMRRAVSCGRRGSKSRGKKKTALPRDSAARQLLEQKTQRLRSTEGRSREQDRKNQARFVRAGLLKVPIEFSDQYRTAHVLRSHTVWHPAPRRVTPAVQRSTMSSCACTLAVARTLRMVSSRCHAPYTWRCEFLGTDARAMRSAGRRVRSPVSVTLSPNC